MLLGRSSPAATSRHARGALFRLAGPQRRDGFTLVELLVACAVLALILVIVFMVISQTSSLWKSTTSKIAAFQNARAAFEAVTRNLSQATLNQYLDYYDKDWKHTTATSTNAPPAHYGRYSELEFVSGPATELFSSPGGKVSHAAFFQAPLGKTDSTNLVLESPDMLNAVGYFVEFGTRSQYEQIPKFLQGSSGADRKGFRLIEWVQPAENLAIYDKSYLGSQPWRWFQDPVNVGLSCRVMAENIVALIILPKGDATNPITTYSYDSSTTGYIEARSCLLPPLLQVTLVAIDEVSAQRLRAIYGDSQPPLIPAGAFQSLSTYDKDMQDLEDVLNGKNGGPKLNYRIFTTTVTTKGSE